MENKKPLFRSQWENPFEPIGQDLSNPYQELFVEIQPYTKDKDGKFLNDSSEPIIKANGKVNIDEKIQSFAKDVDIYSILERFAYSEDNSVINRQVGIYADVSNVPTNFNDLQDFVGDNIDKVKFLNKDVATAILDESKSTSDVLGVADKVVKSRLDNIEKKESDK